MSQENVELVRRANELQHGGDLKGLIGLYHEDAEWRDLQRALDTPEIVRGRAAIFALWMQWMELFDEFRHEIYEYVDAHPWVICDSRWYGKGKLSGAAIDLRVADAFQVQDGKITRIVLSYPDVETALKAVGQE